MGGKSKSEANTENNITNYSLQGMENAETVVTGTNNTVMVTDHGAVDGAFGFGELALESNNEIVNASLKSNKDITAGALKSNATALNNSFGFGELAIESNSEVIKQGFGFAESLVQQNTANSGAATMAIKELAKSVATGGASDVADQSLKTVYTIGGVSVAVVLVMLFMRGAK